MRWPWALLVAITGWSMALAPKTPRMAAASFLSLSGVPVPWVEINSSVASVRPAGAQAWTMAAIVPSRLGWVQWKASDDRPAPAYAASALAPRALAWLSRSSTSAAPPSPMLMPSRPTENGRQVTPLIACSPFQALMPPGLAMASLPPTTAMSARPPAISAAPWAMAWPDEAQALEVANTGPVAPNSMAMALTGALTITRG